MSEDRGQRTEVGGQKAEKLKAEKLNTDEREPFG